ncbi:hypothetical protein N402_00660 [Helicobacter pylori FD423]|nr:hypothetical protein N402_00660 [Helicobacter pylori FD423]
MRFCYWLVLFLGVLKKLCFYQDQYYWGLTRFGLKNSIFKKWVFVLLL